MKCKHCGAELKENSKFCSKCGKKAEDTETATPKASVPALPTVSPVSPKKRRGKGLLILLLILILTGLAAGGFIYYNFQNSRSQEASRGSQWEHKDSEKKDSEKQSSSDETDSSQESSSEADEETGQTEESTPADETGMAVPAAAETAVPVTESAPLHRYEIILKDCTWTEAFDDALSKGGYLVQINSMDEYDYIRSNLLNTEASRELKLWIGGVRVSGNYEYHWAGADGTLSQDILNSDSYPGVWMSGEPSYRDNGISQDEYYVNLFYYTKENRWVWNDAPNDIIAAVSRYRGTVGYICEYEQ